MNGLNQTPAVRLVLFLLAPLLAATPLYAQQTLNATGFSSQSVTTQSTAPKHVSVGHVSGAGLTGQTSFATSHEISEVKGDATQTIVGAPDTGSSFEIEAELLRPDPANSSRPFQTAKHTARMPDLSKKEVYWTPNQQTLVFNR